MTERAIRILLGDNHEIVRLGLHALLDPIRGIAICGDAADGREAVTLARQLKPDIVILDAIFSHLSGVDAAREIRGLPTCPEVLFFTNHYSEVLVHDALDTGAIGYVLKTDAASSLIRGVEALSQHRPYFSPEISSFVIDGYHNRARHSRGSKQALSPREREILVLVAEGLTSKEVAGRIGVSVKTADVHRANLMRKLNCHSVVDLVRYAIRNELVDIGGLGLSKTP